MRRMPEETLDQRRARFVRTVLAWHGKRPGDLAKLLDREASTAYKKLYGQRAFTSDDLLKIADQFRVEPGLLLRPPAELAELGGDPQRMVKMNWGPMPAEATRWLAAA